MMLLNKNFFLKHSNILKLLSFNIKTINSTIFNIRNIIKYIFFFILKKTFFLKLLFSYNIFLYLLQFKYVSLFNIYNSFSCYFFNMNLNIVNNYMIKQYYNFFIFSNLNNSFYLWYHDFKEKSKHVTVYLDFVNYNYFYYLYKTYIFIIYIWLYSLKFLNFFSVNINSIPSKKKLLTVLRSPHKDKKSREQFKIRRLKNNFLYPSFINNKYFFSFFINETILIKNDIFFLK